MPVNAQGDTGRSGGRGERRRLRGMLASKTGKAIGFTTIAAPLIGYVVNDLKKPDSIIGRLIGVTLTKLLSARSPKVEVIDVTRDAEIIDDGSDTNNKNDRVD